MQVSVYIKLHELLYNSIIKLKFASPLKASQNMARFSVPAINHPRCGRGWKMPPLEIVNYNLDTAPISVRMHITGLLENSVIEYTSQPTQEQENKNTLNFILMNNMLDQDFTVQFKTTSPLPMQCYLTPENDHYIGLFNLIAPQTKSTSSDISLELIMDCSGSIMVMQLCKVKKLPMQF